MASYDLLSAKVPKARQARVRRQRCQRLASSGDSVRRLHTSPPRMRDVEEAQVEIVAIAKDLADKGEIIISDGGGEDELVY